MPCMWLTVKLMVYPDFMMYFKEILAHVQTVDTRFSFPSPFREPGYEARQYHALYKYIKTLAAAWSFSDTALTILSCLGKSCNN